MWQVATILDSTVLDPSHSDLSLLSSYLLPLLLTDLMFKLNCSVLIMCLPLQYFLARSWFMLFIFSFFVVLQQWCACYCPGEAYLILFVLE